MLRTAGLMLPWSLVGILVWSERPYPLDLASHFLLHAAAVIVLLGAILLLFRRRIAGLNLLLVAVAITIGWRLSMSVPAGGVGDDPSIIRLVLFNAQEESSRHDNAAFGWIRDQRPDVIVLIEPPWGLLNDYPDLRRDYPYVVEPRAGLMWSVILLSRFPATVEPLVPYSEEIKFSFVARRSLLVRPPAAAPFLLTAMHPPSPRTRETWRLSLEGTELNARLLGDWGKASPYPIIVAGDFNSTPVGRVHRLFERLSGLTGWTPMVNAGTWPASMPRWLSIPIDRVWTGGGAIVRSVRIGPGFRSDHRPVAAEIVLPANRSELGDPGGVSPVPEEESRDSVR